MSGVGLMDRIDVMGGSDGADARHRWDGYTRWM